MCTFVCSSGSQIKFDTRENMMESVGVFCSSLEDRKNGITVAITLQQVTTLSSSTAYILMDVASSTAQRKRLLFPVISLRFLGLVVLESRVPSISFLGGIFTGWVRNPDRGADLVLHPAYR